MEPINLPGKLESLSEIGKYVMNVAKQASLDKKLAYKLRLAVDEMATNIITHGYEESGLEGNIQVEGNVETDRIVITLKDTGIPYDPTQRIFDQDLSLPLQERTEGGLGVFLAIDGVDQFLYERQENINRNTIIVKLT
jgi:anti-sigma regulatory factor (Ser/Thr protein kinase)